VVEIFTGAIERLGNVRRSWTDDDISTVEFRLIVFRPFKHEVIIGRISSATDMGIRSTFSL
jgi:DNA-directed RNA polymerase subunit E'/Rpb7